MKIAILGSGVIGVTSAWYLAKAGHEVTVIDRQDGPALETSFANAGEISPGYASPWAAPGIPMKAVKWLMMKHAPLILRPHADMAMLRWLVAMLGNCNARDYAINKSRMVRLAEFSRDCLIALRGETGIRYDERSRGTLQLFREQKQLDGIGKDIAVLQADGVPFEVLDRAGCIAAEPGLAASTAPIVGGLRLPNDETGDCFKFTNALAAMAAAKGVEFRNGINIQRLIEEGGRIVRVETDKGSVSADVFLVAMGSFSPQLVAPLSIRLPVYPVKGYSLTVPIVDEARAPVSTLLDESYKVAITRLGDRIRVGGMAEISGFSRDLPPERRATLEHSAGSLFPGGGDLEAASFWCGLRPMTPDSTPVIGPTRVSNLFLNTGHGTLGWTMACGSAHVITDLIGGRRPAIEASDLAISRY
ncbi:D-amino acid dehydrogenase [Novosphingobium resinovorum]|uniref:D-amino acid dehydrogenase n=1 Tax=Novosphingobium resinovorum TaxID=158500 RepID=A0A031K0F3_9SPHN|nr:MULTISPECIES: D-amino acid dehydrogenase [Sphingomonadaceae]AOR79119.1 D-amino acid dehydrogenase small subunit [Novosphingobium resinovorum]EJU13974.1 D-amino acid dehydrogenase small subunit [Sphingomonas sp. LH128]EZP82674.1 D-amino acid dehydrogenase small subunit [Novosphingobium resinovorum]MBF7014679.1 D-amino acid dehydrogenase [Novosphingobium sp. HR1a]WJM24839.1 D-amino acid dehydrogenase [Novosphingobium resinovorum]